MFLGGLDWLTGWFIAGIRHCLMMWVFCLFVGCLFWIGLGSCLFGLGYFGCLDVVGIGGVYDCGLLLCGCVSV